MEQLEQQGTGLLNGRGGHVERLPLILSSPPLVEHVLAILLVPGKSFVSWHGMFGGDIEDKDEDDDDGDDEE